jgi:hypothetical protein
VPSTKQTPPANLAQPCPELPKPDGPTAGDLLAHDLAVVGLYQECAAGKAALIEWAR